MKGFKKIVAVIIAVVITASVLCVIPSNAAVVMTFQPTIEGSYIFGIPEKTTFNGLAAALPPKTILGVKNLTGGNVAAGSATFIGTGFTIILNGNSYTAVVLGDVDGNGQINATDYLRIKRHYLGTFTITGANLVAATGKDGASLKAIRYLMVKRHVLDPVNNYNMNVNYIIPYVEPSDDESGWTNSWV